MSAPETATHAEAAPAVAPQPVAAAEAERPVIAAPEHHAVESAPPMPHPEHAVHPHPEHAHPAAAPEVAHVPAQAPTMHAPTHPEHKEHPQAPEGTHKPVEHAPAHTPTPLTANVVVHPEVLLKAEENLAKFAAVHLPEELRPANMPLSLDLRAALGNGAGVTDLVVAFNGEMVKANPDLFGQHAIEMLEKIPTIKALDEHNKPFFVHNGSALEVHIRHLTDAQYAHLVQSLAQGVALEAPVEAKKEMPAEVAAIATPATPASLDAALAAAAQPDHQCTGGANCAHCAAAHVAANDEQVAAAHSVPAATNAATIGHAPLTSVAASTVANDNTLQAAAGVGTARA